MHSIRLPSAWSEQHRISCGVGRSNKCARRLSATAISAQSLMGEREQYDEAVTGNPDGATSGARPKSRTRSKEYETSQAPITLVRSVRPARSDADLCIDRFAIHCRSRWGGGNDRYFARIGAGDQYDAGRLR